MSSGIRFTPVRTPGTTQGLKRNMTQQLEFVSSVELLVDQIVPSKLNPRTEFDRSELEKFAQNIKERGIIHPITVRPIGEDDYEIADGERRWLAAKQLGMKHVPVIIRDLTDQDVIELNLIENIQLKTTSKRDTARLIPKKVFSWCSSHQSARHWSISLSSFSLLW